MSVLLTLCALLALCACAPRGEDGAALQAQWTLTPQPPVEGPLEIELALTDAQGRPVEGARVAIEGNMTHPGMVPELATAAEAAPGIYRARIELTMGGDWYLLADIVLPDGRKRTEQMDLPRVRGR